MTTSRHARRAFAPLLPLLLLLCAAATEARAQRAYKIDETDNTRCDLSEVLQVGAPSAAVFDALARQPGAKAAVVVHAPQPGEALRYARRVRRWLTEGMGVVPDRL